MVIIKMVWIMIYRVESILSKVGSGVTDPLNGMINNNHAIIKTINNDEGNRVLANEIVCYRIAKALNLPIPDGGICCIDKYTQIDQEVEFPKDRYGKGFYTYRLDRVTNIVNSPLLISKYIRNKNDFLRIILFDHLIYNKDRHKGNLLMDIVNKGNNKIYIIDHSHVFNLGPLWDECQLSRMIKEEDYKSTEIMEYNEGVYYLLLQSINLSIDVLIKEAKDFKNMINDEFLQNAIKEIPEEWNIVKNDRIMLFNYIKYRLDNIENICEVIYNYVRK